ncbi:MAG: GntR family transcriptional regulator [Candidatus Eremiobacteraeota bacterium]|nr:GntR family transcriptional regulator [Candidatus Eremiobacteraeota bacterium]
MNSPLLDRSSTASRVADLLRERIAAGIAAPGSRIVELDVARELGVSRSPVREALLRLAQEELVSILPYRGAIVAPLQRRRLVELMEFRMALEHFALERLVARSSDDALRELKAALGAVRVALRSRNRRRIVEADLAVHRTLVACANNALLERAYDGLLAQIRRYIDVTSARYGRPEELAEEHEAFLQAVERRELAVAREILDAHIRHGLEQTTAETSHGRSGRNPRRITAR